MSVDPAVPTPFLREDKKSKKKKEIEDRQRLCALADSLGPKPKIYDGNDPHHVCPSGYSHVRGYCRIIKKKRGKYLTKRRMQKLLKLEKSKKS